MSRTLTEAAFLITADAGQVTKSLEEIKTKTRETAKAGVDGFGSMAGASQKAANATLKATEAIETLGSRGKQSFTGLTQAGGQFASLLGPQGAVVGAVALALVAIVGMFTRTKRELKELKESAATELRDLERTKDATALAQRVNRLSSGDRLYGDPNSDAEKDNDALRRKNEAIRKGGINALRAEQEAIQKLLREFGPAADAGGEAVERFNKRQAALQVRLAEVTEVQGQLTAELTDAQQALQRVAEETAGVEQNALRLKAAEEAATKAREQATASAKQQATALEGLARETENLLNTLQGVSASQKAATQVAQLIDKYEKAGVPIRKVQQDLIGLYQTLETQSRDGNAGAAETEKQIDGLTSKYGFYLDTLDQLAQGLETVGAAEEAAKTTRGSIDALEKNNTQTRDRNKLLVEQAERIAAASKARADSITDLEAEAAAVQKGSAAYRELLQQRAVAAQLAADATAKGAPLTATEKAQSTTEAINLFNRAEVALTAINNAAEKGIDPLVSQFADIAQYALQIADALGESGQGLAKGAGITLSIFKALAGLQSGLVKRDANGKVVTGEGGVPQTIGIASALLGRNGNAASGQASQAAVLGSVASIAGVVVGIADALDLFGTRAKQQREELRQRAEEFNASLGEFARSITERGIGEFAAQRNQLATELGELVGKAAATAGLQYKGSSRLSAESLRQYEAQLRSQASGLLGDRSGSGKDQAARAGEAVRLLAFADAINAVGKEAEKAEADLRKQQAAAIKVASEDLEVRRLSALGLTEEADARRRQLEQQRELEAAITDFAGADGYQAYITALQEAQAAELASAQATAKRTAALAELDAALSILGESPIEQAQRTFKTLAETFPEEFGDMFSNVDLTSKEGLEAAREALREQFRALSADGISDAEQPIVEAIQRALGVIAGAMGTLSEGLEEALAAFAVKTEVFGLSLQEQFTGLAEIFGKEFEGLGDLLGDALPTDGAGRSALRTRLQDAIAEILADGEISDTEAPYLDALRNFLDLVNGAIDEATAALEAERTARVAAADQKLQGKFAFEDLTDNERLQAQLRSAAGLSPVFASLLELFSDTSLSGIANSKDALYELFRQIEAGEIPLEQFGDLTKDEVIATILELNGGLGGLAEALLSAADAAEKAADAEREQTTNLNLRLQKSKGVDTRLAEFDDRAAKERKQAAESGRSKAFLSFLDQVLASERAKLLGDIADETSAAVSDTLVRTKSVQHTQLTQTVGNLTEITGQSIAGYLRSIDNNTRSMALTNSALFSRLTGLQAPTPISTPSFAPLVTTASGGAAGSSSGTQNNAITVNVAPPVIQLPPGASPEAFSKRFTAAQVRDMSEQIGRLTHKDIQHLGRFDV